MSLLENDSVQVGLLVLLIGVIVLLVHPFGYFASTFNVFWWSQSENILNQAVINENGNNIIKEKYFQLNLGNGETTWVIREIPSDFIIIGTIRASNPINFIITDAMDFNKYLSIHTNNSVYLIHYQKINNAEYMFTAQKSEGYYFIFENLDNTTTNSIQISGSGHSINPIVSENDLIFGLSSIFFGMLLIFSKAFNIPNVDSTERKRVRKGITKLVEILLSSIFGLLLTTSFKSYI